LSLQYYRVFLTTGKRKKEQRDITMFVKTFNGLDGVFVVIRKKSFAKYHTIQHIDRETYQAGVQAHAS